MSVITAIELVSPPRPGARPVPLAPDLLADIAAGLASTDALWREHVHHDPARRQPVRLVACDLWEAWVVGWTPGQHVEMHDHGDSAGVLVVVEGDLVEIVPAGPHQVRRTLPEGSVLRLPVGVVHDVAGVGPGEATSIHVYSPPLGTMTYYDDDGRPSRVDELDDEPVITDLRRVARALHPSQRRG
jgi:predicted metal-dependent enzyme (double-stranded beta helix superfamily)